MAPYLNFVFCVLFGVFVIVMSKNMRTIILMDSKKLKQVGALYFMVSGVMFFVTTILMVTTSP